ncbi:gamma-glutamylcyclotransferase [Streptomyces sp. BE147]|uniref:gamma-glutamylcyclotransferase family protein n=1 Tax=Streptomyces sp. BE147 TaxID=3002524 RepID=UPI002E75C3CA|nr:gamma-glutamylcyclotransferase family protein [Streptomyces sp. BE147]MEE1741173.1 gamma-glutamylcyclotransferase [Streptomyces sp. BE147]
MFCYGTLQFDAVLKALLGRIPEQTPASAPGYRAAALEGRAYPGLVTRASIGSAPSLLLTDLSNEEWRILDTFEDDQYELLEIPLSDGTSGWAYVWPGRDVLAEDWDATNFEAQHLSTYVERCARLGRTFAAG